MQPHPTPLPAQVGNTPGVTKGVQEIHLDKSIRLLDSPGVVFSSASDDASAVLRNCVKVRPGIKRVHRAAASICLGFWSRLQHLHEGSCKYDTQCLSSCLLSSLTDGVKQNGGGSAELDRVTASVLQTHAVLPSFSWTRDLAGCR